MAQCAVTWTARRSMRSRAVSVATRAGAAPHDSSSVPSLSVLRVVRVSGPVLPLGTAALLRDGGERDVAAAAVAAAGYANSPLLAVHAATKDFCGVGTTVSVRRTERGGVQCVSDGRRYKVLSNEFGEEDDVVIARCERVRDEPSPSVLAMENESRLVDAVESLVRLRGGRDGLPDAIFSHMPDAAMAMQKHYLAAHSEVQTWRRSRAMPAGTYGRPALPAKSRVSSNPYKVMTEKFDVSWRRELFTFAVAEVCALSDIEKMALISLFDTVGRQQFLLAKLTERLKVLAAEKALRTP